MTTETKPQPEQTKRSDAANWARPVQTLDVGELPNDAINLNVKGKRVTGPLKGFGQLWQKTYKIRLEGIELDPKELIKTWKAHFPEYWPEGNRFYGSLDGIQAGDVAVLNLAGPARSSISTGILVIYADDESFSFMTPQGHIFAGMNTFSAYVEDGATVAQIQVLVRASDIFYEIGCRLGFTHKMEDEFWRGTLRNLAAGHGVEAIAQQTNVLVDNKVQWSEWANVWHNAAARTMLYMPVRMTRRLFKR